MERISEIMMKLIASDVCGKEINLVNLHLSDDDLKQLYTLSKKARPCPSCWRCADPSQVTA